MLTGNQEGRAGEKNRPIQPSKRHFAPNLIFTTRKHFFGQKPIFAGKRNPQKLAKNVKENDSYTESCKNMQEKGRNQGENYYYVK